MDLVSLFIRFEFILVTLIITQCITQLWLLMKDLLVFFFQLIANDCNYKLTLLLAYEAGLRPGDLITHINGESVQGLYHTQVLQLLLSSQEHVTLRATPLKNTSIQIGGRKREPGQSKMAKKVNSRPKKQKSSSDKKRRASLFRRISSKIANAEIQQVSSKKKKRNAIQNIFV